MWTPQRLTRGENKKPQAVEKLSQNSGNKIPRKPQQSVQVVQVSVYSGTPASSDPGIGGHALFLSRFGQVYALGDGVSSGLGMLSRAIETPTLVQKFYVVRSQLPTDYSILDKNSPYMFVSDYDERQDPIEKEYLHSQFLAKGDVGWSKITEDGFFLGNSVSNSHISEEIGTWGVHSRQKKWGFGKGKENMQNAIGKSGVQETLFGNQRGNSANGKDLVLLRKAPQIVKVCAGEGCSTALSSDGEVYSWGLNANGRLGFRCKYRAQLRPRRLELNALKKKTKARPNPQVKCTDIALGASGYSIIKCRDIGYLGTVFCYRAAIILSFKCNFQ